ncbi:hypothetical protein J0A68_04380 [Algoriphagus sp. H41]|uniref:Uncharacterized protein n=1 Tax=Algoriphagus oliviformis TaxID=2811231 RepID=A0ABS3C204_9BACT|nr:hypothetical protein [Algoriphagus oliviformis]MBN7810181.1 hypothetical protein [Algoriphagus oliviformis]
MTIDLKEISNGLPGLSKVSGQHLFESCVVCLTRQSHSNTGTTIEVKGDTTVTTTLIWDNIFDDQLDRTWKDQFYATEHGAVCIAILLALKLTEYTIIEKSARKNGFDYWLGDNDDILFQKKARLEISGIFQGTEKDVKKRYDVKVKQTQQSDALKIPAYIGIVEFSNPIANWGSKK